MNDPLSPERITIEWSPEARVDIRAIDKTTAMQILSCIDRYLSGRTGEVKKLKPPLTDFRLRCGDYRIFFRPKGESTIEITGVYHRRDAYR